MLILGSRSWLLKNRRFGESRVTPETVYRDRRRFLHLLGLGLGAAAAGVRPSSADEEPAAPAASTVRRNPRYAELDRPLTGERLAARHNVFDEFSLARDQVWKAAEGFRTRPWTVHVGGAVEREIVLDAEELVRRCGGVEERLYRHRCVETWAMAVPWTGFPLRKLVELARPLAAARYLRMVSFHHAEEAPGWYASRRVFPYYEALSLAEATHDLAFVASGIYGRPLPPQHGAPLRLAVPWKYGFKSLKSIVAFQFTRRQPGTFWGELAPHLYGFEANVDPTATHPWPQAEETMLGSDETRKTLPFNGYAEEVAGLYA